MDQPASSRPDRTIEDVGPDAASRARAGQAEQMEELGGTPTTPTVPAPMARGMAKGALVGAVVGALLLTPLAIAPILDLPVFARLVICWIAGARGEQANAENQEYLYGEDPHERRQGPGIG